LKLAQEYIKEYLDFYIAGNQWHMFTFLTHELLHMVDDAERFGCALGNLSAYANESYLSTIPKVSLDIIFQSNIQNLYYIFSSLTECIS
jgi:hypothetical protein